MRKQLVLGIKHTLLRKLQVQVAAYDYRVYQQNGPVSPLRLIEVAREVADNYKEVRQSRNAGHAAYNLGLRADRAAKGLCLRCGKVPPRADRVSCSDCGRRDVESSRRRYDPLRKKPKKEKQAGS